MASGLDYETVVARFSSWVVNKPKYVILAFLLITFVMMTGLGGISTSSGTEQFTEEVPEFDAFENVNDKFEPTFENDESSTSLIQSSQNVLSKTSLLRMLKAQYRLEQRADFQVTSTSSAARTIASTLDPSATTLEEQINAVEEATPSEIDAAVQRLSDNPLLTRVLSEDFNAKSAYASATIGSVSHDVEGGGSGAGSQGGTTPLTKVQVRAQDVVESVGGDIRVFGSGILSKEFQNVIVDSLKLVIPVVVVLLLVFLIVAYRDPFDLVMGLVSLIMAVIWTFGFMGLVGIPFSQMLIAVPPLILAVGIDFGIHTVNRYREERVEGAGIREAMETGVRQLIVAFFIVTGTTVIGFLSNLTSALGPIRSFGIVASIGIVFTTLIFGVFLPAAKIYLDRLREGTSIPEFGSKPLGSEDSFLGKILSVGAKISDSYPVIFLLGVVVLTVFSGYYATGVSTSFSQDDFLPTEETPGYVEYFPQALQPHKYTVTETTNFLEERFATSEQDTVTVYVEGSLQENYVLDQIYKAGNDPPDTFIVEDGHASSRSIVTVINSYARASPEFARLVQRHDLNGNGVPDTGLEKIYDELLDSRFREQALNYMTEDARSARVVYSVEADASDTEITADARQIAEEYPYTAIATGNIVIFEAVSDVIFESAIQSLALALLFTSIFLIIIYYIMEGRWTLGLVNIAPIVVTVTMLAATMRFFGIPFNSLTATILSVTIGLGVDYSVHTVHRFIDEYEESGDINDALVTTLQGTGGALTGSMLTTGAGMGALVLAITPILGQFGMLMFISVFYALITSVLVLPSVIVVWERWTKNTGIGESSEGQGQSGIEQKTDSA
ncbi:MAG: MMPL family transporter [Halobacteria archaeon]|nr:MMPL family transporter [Halobacteria archaeon]